MQFAFVLLLFAIFWMEGSVSFAADPNSITKPSDGVLTVKAGESISIPCDATGDTKQVITWMKPVADKRENIPVSNATHVNAGTCECNCTARLDRVRILYAPKVRMGREIIIAGEGANVNITCIVEGEPRPTVTWTQKGTKVHPSDDPPRMVQNRVHALVLHNVSATDFGVYKCTARNTLGSASGSTHLTKKQVKCSSSTFSISISILLMLALFVGQLH